MGIEALKNIVEVRKFSELKLAEMGKRLGHLAGC